MDLFYAVFLVGFVCSFVCFGGFFGHASWHAEVPGPGIEAMPQQQPSPLQ